MRTEEQRWRPYVEPLRAAANRARTRLGRGGMRLAVLAALAVAMGGAAWLARHRGGAAQPVGYEWLYDARSFRDSEAAPVLAALKAAEIPCVESGGRVGVPRERRIDALEVLARAKLGPRGIEDLLDQAAGGGSFWESPDDRSRRERRDRGQVAGELISQLRHVVSATVMLNPTESGTRLNPATRLKAMAVVETEGDQVLSRATVEMIRNILTSIDDVEPDAISLFNAKAGHEYLVAGQPEIAVRSSVRGREEELRTRLLEQIGIDGALVSVRIDVPAAPATPKAAPTAAPIAGVVGPARLNRPIGEVEVVESPAPTAEIAADPGATPIVGDLDSGRATVLIRIPRSHYLRLFRALEPTRAISPEALAPLAERVQNTVRTVVHAVIPPAELGRLTIDRFDDTEPSGPVVEIAKPARDGRVSLPDWLPAALAVGLAVVGLAALAGGWLASRRPTTRAALSHAARGPHLRIPPSGAEPDDAYAPGEGPTRQIEALVHRDPAAAAGVLRRWINQGGHDR